MPFSRVLPVVLSVLLLAGACATVRPPEPPPESFRVVIISDLNSSYGSTEYEPAVHHTMRRIVEEWRPDLVLAGGDMIAGQKPSLTDEQVAAMWAAFDSTVARPLRQAGIPFGFTVGNHDASGYPAHARDRRFAVDFWRDPAHAPGVAFVDGTHYPLYYSFRHGDLFVLVWDASTAETIRNAEMMAWVEQQLAGDAARTARYRWALGHLPLYGIAEGRAKAGEVLREGDSLRVMLENLGVDLYVSGHQHAYYPARRGALDLLNTGALGQGARKLIGSDLAPRQTVTVADFSSDGIAFTTYEFDESQTVMRPVDHAALPPSIDGYNGTVTLRAPIE